MDVGKGNIIKCDKNIEYSLFTGTVKDFIPNCIKKLQKDSVTKKIKEQ